MAVERSFGRFGGSLWGAAKAASHALPDPPRRILLASTGVPFAPEVVRKVVEIADPAGAQVTVISVARVFGTSLGIPHPGLQPTRREMDEQRRIVDQAAKMLRRKGLEVRVSLTRSRNAPKMIARWGSARRFHAIVVPDPARPRWRRVVEGDLAHEIHRRCGIPVHAVPIHSERSARSA